MNNNPEYVEVNGKKYKINTDFRVAIECDKVARDGTINDFERSLGIIMLLYGEKAIDDGLEDSTLYPKLLNLAKKYLSCGKELNIKNNKEPDMDFEEDMPYIEASFMSDYHIDLDGKEMHFWKFMKLINGLSNSELGNCCVLNNVRNLRNLDVSRIEDKKLRQELIEAKKQVALKRNKKENHLTKEQERSMNELNKMLGL